MHKYVNNLTFNRFFIVWFLFFYAFVVFAQDDEYISDDEYYETEEEAAPEQESVPEQESGSMFGSEDESAVVSTKPKNDDRVSAVQNAILEGIQLSSEKGETEDQIIVTCYFIFKEQPTSYFYDSKLRDKKIVFEFNDTELGSSPIPSVQEPPIQGFRIEETKLNVNAEVQGLNPEWHDVLKVSLFLDAVPEITVKDEYSIISFSFKWSKDPDKAKGLAVKDKNPKIVIFSIAGLGVAAGGVAGYLLWKKSEPEPPKPDEPLDIEDRPQHPPDPD